MKEYLIAYVRPDSNVLKYGNIAVTAFSKRGAIDAFRTDNKAVILNVIELD